MLINLNASSFSQRFSYKNGASATAKSIFASTHDSFATKEHEETDPLQKRRLKAKLKKKTQHSKQARIERAQSDLLEGKGDILRKLKQPGVKLPKECKSLLATMKQASTMLQEMKHMQSQNEVKEQQPQQTQQTQPPTLKSRLSVEEEEQQQKAMRNRRKRDKKKKQKAAANQLAKTDL